MQTFIPFPSIEKTVRCLDYRRLGKQRVEAYQILLAITGKTKGWVNHPCTKMWVGHEDFLKYYINMCISEWCRRGYKNNMNIYILTPKMELPEWYGGKIHRTHQLMLLKKDTEYYSRFFSASTEEITNAEYYWPTKL